MRSGPGSRFASPDNPGLLIALGLFSGVAFMGSLLVGPSSVGWTELLDLIWGQASGPATLILLEIRMPRALLGMMVGVTLGLSGAALQGYLRNPLAEPGLIGVSASASFGAVVMIYTGLAGLFTLALPLGGIVGAFAAVALIQVISGKNAGTLHLILAGIAITSFASALTSLAINLAPNPFASLEIMFWLMGSLADRSYEQVWLAAPFMVAGWCVLLPLGRPLDALILGEDVAQSMGFNVARVRKQLVAGTALCVGAATAVTGTIGFVGLVVPHLLRKRVGNKPGSLMLASALGGACLTLTADIAVRILSHGQELKLGVLTALIGGPFFLLLIMKARREWP